MRSNHTISAGGVVQNQKGEILLVEQRNQVWSLPKGHLDRGEDALTAAQREIREESGVQNLTLIKKLGNYYRYKIGEDGIDDQNELKEIHLFLFSTDETELNPEDIDSHPRAIWVKPEEVKNYLTHPKDLEFFEKILPELI